MRRPGMRFFFGDDICISYARLDGAIYATALANDLTKEKLSCRLDQWGTSPGREVPNDFMDALMRSSVLVVVATKASGSSLAVKKEVEAFLTTKRPIIPIDLDGTIRDATWWPLLDGLAVSPEGSEDGTPEFPAESVVNRIKNSSGFTRRNQRLARSVIASIVLLGAILMATLYASLEALEQTKIAGYIRALSTLQFGEIVKADDPAMAIRFAALAEKIDPTVTGTDLMTAALYKNPAWARFPTVYAPEATGDLFPTFSEEFSFLADRNIKYVARQQINAGTRTVTVNEVDSGMVKATLKLAEDERLFEERPYARELLVTHRSPDASGTRKFSVYAFSDIAASGRMAPALRTDAVLFSCAYGTWPCFAMSSEQRLKRCSPNSGCKDVGIGPQFAATELLVHPSGKAVLLLYKNGMARWIATEGEGQAATAKDLQFNSGRWYIHRPSLPWFRWGPEPSHLLVMVPNWTGKNSSGPQSRIVLTAVDVRTGTQQKLTEILPMANGLAKPLFETNRSASRVMVNGTDPGQIAMLSVIWSPSPHISDVRGRGQLSRLSIANSSESAANTLSGAVSPTGLYTVVGYDQRGLSGTQAGLGVLKSWNLDALDEVSSARPEAADLPIQAKRHVGRIAYSDDSRRLAALDSSGVVTVFNVRASAPPPLSTEYRVPEDLEERLNVTPIQLDLHGRHWLLNFSDQDHQVFDVQNGNVISLEKSIGCGRVLSAKVIGSELVVASETCLGRLRDGAVNRFPLPQPLQAAVVGKTLISGRTVEHAFFFSTDDFHSRGYARLDDNQVLREVITETQTSADAKRAEFQVPEIYPADGRVRMFRHTDAGELEAWTATPSSSAQALSFELGWRRTLPADSWYSIRRLIDPDILMIATGSNSYQTAPAMVRLQGASGKIHPGYQNPDTTEGIFEVAELFRSGEIGFTAIRLAHGAMRIERWDITKGMVAESFLLEGADAGSSNSVYGVQEKAGVPLIFVAMKKGGAEIGAFSLRNGKLSWSGTKKGRLLPHLEFKNGKLSQVNDATTLHMEKLVAQGGAGLADRLTRLQVSDADLETLLRSR